MPAVAVVPPVVSLVTTGSSAWPSGAARWGDCLRSPLAAPGARVGAAVALARSACS